MHTPVLLRSAETDADLRACFPVLAELRPALRDADEFIASYRRMHAEGYRVLAAWQGETAVAFGGYRVQENFVFGKFLYVDDLATTSALRGRGWGQLLLDGLADLARAQGCDRLVLDTGLANALAQRFYFRSGLLSAALRFAKTL